MPIAGDTRESFTVDELQSGLQYRFVLPGPVLSAQELERCLQTLAALRPAPEFVVLSGSFPPGTDLAFFDDLRVLTLRLGARLVVDLSGEPLCHAARHGGVYLMKPSLEELSTLMGGAVTSEAEQQEALRSLIARGCAEIVVLSLGPRVRCMPMANGWSACARRRCLWSAQWGRATACWVPSCRHWRMGVR